MSIIKGITIGALALTAIVGVPVMIVRTINTMKKNKKWIKHHEEVNELLDEAHTALKNSQKKKMES